ncbi:2OG-Fe(II) oxygenase family protein [Streptomyces sp. NPDC001307]|uniref:2OG-Fe(II) oxygenase family protein n=1 Tax=Streptomyces sp. NPDC001307 TaxID=3364560 RepID=UPI003683F680
MAISTTELRGLVLRWQAEALRVSREVLRALAAALGQDEGYFDQWFDDEAAAHVKIVHYPPRAAEDADQGVGAHKDYGYLALLQQDEVGGLQVQREDGVWIDAVPAPDAFVDRHAAPPVGIRAGEPRGVVPCPRERT